MSFLRNSLCAVACASLCLLLTHTTDAFAQRAARPLITAPVDDAVRVTVAGNTRLEARNPANDRGAVPDEFRMDHVWLQLKRSPAQEAALISLIDAMHDPKSPEFHHWLTAKQFGATYGVDKQDIATIQAWLTGHGFRVDSVFTNRMVIEFSGNAGQVRSAFHTEIHSLVVEGEEHFANISDPQIPASLAPAVEGVVSLNNFHPVAPVAALHQRQEAQGGLHADYTVSSSLYNLVPADAQTIYNLAPIYAAGFTGQGQTIAVVENGDVYSLTDFASYRSKFGLSTAYPSGNVVQIFPKGSAACSDPGIGSSAEEAELDMEMATAIAPGATVEVAACENSATISGSVIAVENLLNAASVPPVISNSYGACEAGAGATYNALISSAYQQAVAQGVSVFASAGDTGAAGCESTYQEPAHNYAEFGANVNALAGTAYNVSVGGTDFQDGSLKDFSTYWNSTNATNYGSAKSYIPEIPWDNSCANSVDITYGGGTDPLSFCNSTSGEKELEYDGGGGGASSCFTGAPDKTGAGGTGTCAPLAKPSWQTGVFGIPAANKRYQPDVSLFASNRGWGHEWVICYSNLSDKYGASCAGAPSTWTGVGGTSASAPVMAAIQLLIDQKYGLQGNPNYVYYALAATEYGSSGSSACNSNKTGGPASTCVFYDITVGDNSVNCKGTNDCFQPQGLANGVLSTSDTTLTDTYPAMTGYDLATGIGSVNAGNLFAQWNTIANTGAGNKIGTHLTFSVSANPVTQGATLTVYASLYFDSGAAPTGNLDYTVDGGTLVGMSCAGTTSPLSCTGTVPTTGLSQGSHILQVIYAGSATDYPSSSPAGSVTVTAPVISAPATNVSLKVLKSFSQDAFGARPGPLMQASDGNYYGVTDYGAGNSAGVAYKLDPSNNFLPTVIHQFNLATEGTPQSGLIEGPSGLLYGVGEISGQAATFFSLSTSGTCTVLHNFGPQDANFVVTQPTLGSDGNFYIVSEDGGTSGNGAVMQVTPSGTATLLHSFDYNDGAQPQGSLMQDKDGSYYAAAYLGGPTQQNGSIYKITVSGSTATFQTVTAFETQAANVETTLMVGENGLLYGVGQGGGSSLAGTLFDSTTSGTVNDLDDFANGAAGGTGGTQAFILGSDGNFYGGTYQVSQGSYQGSVYAMTPTGTLTTLSNNDGSLTGNLVLVNTAWVQGSDGSFYGGTEEGGSGGYGDAVRLTMTPALYGPVQVNALGTPKAGAPLTISYSVSNGFALTYQQCYAYVQGGLAGAGTFTGKLTGTATASGWSGSAQVTPKTGGTYTYAVTCGGLETGFVKVTVAPGSLGASISASATPDPVITGNNVTLNVNVSSANGTPAGTINFKYAGTVVYSTKLDGNGNAVFVANTNGLGANTYSIEVDYVPSDDHLATSTTLPVTVVNKTASTTVVTLTPASVPSGNAITVTATVTGTAPTGNVTLSVAGSTIGSFPLVAKNSTSATVTLTPTTTGFVPTTYPITASYGGDSRNTSSSGSATATVTPSSQVIITATPNPVPPDGTVTLTFKAQANGYNGPVATGSMNIKLNGVNYTTVPLTNGVVQFPYDTTGFPPGGYVLTGTYLPDGSSTYPSSTTTYVVSLN